MQSSHFVEEDDNGIVETSGMVSGGGNIKGLFFSINCNLKQRFI